MTDRLGEMLFPCGPTNVLAEYRSLLRRTASGGAMALMLHQYSHPNDVRRDLAKRMMLPVLIGMGVVAIVKKD